jgi:hypothetical protein
MVAATSRPSNAARMLTRVAPCDAARTPRRCVATSTRASTVLIEWGSRVRISALVPENVCDLSHTEECPADLKLRMLFIRKSMALTSVHIAATRGRGRLSRPEGRGLPSCIPKKLPQMLGLCRGEHPTDPVLRNQRCTIGIDEVASLDLGSVADPLDDGERAGMGERRGLRRHDENAAVNE